MANHALNIEVLDTATQLRHTYSFDRTPIRIGRSALNDLPLDRPFVSHCHGVLHFTHKETAFVDLGSTNGTFLGALRIPQNQAVSVNPGSVLTMGALQLRVNLAAGAYVDTRASYAFRADKAPIALPPDGALAPADALSCAVGFTVAPEAHAALIERAGQVLERFALAFIELRRGQRQFAADLAVGVTSAGNLSQIDDARALLAYVLDPKAPEGRVDELSRAYADLMLHQVALLNGMLAGARDVLSQLAPTSLSPPELQKGPVARLLRALRRNGRWARFRARFDELREEGTLSHAFFGRSFARAYAAAMGQTLAPSATAPSPKPVGCP